MPAPEASGRVRQPFQQRLLGLWKLPRLAGAACRDDSPKADTRQPRDPQWPLAWTMAERVPLL